MKTVKLKPHWRQDIQVVLAPSQISKRYEFFAQIDVDEKKIEISKKLLLPENHWYLEGYIAHEIRHLEHVERGYFKDYYLKNKNLWKLIKRNPKYWLVLAQTTEDDCNLAAFNHLKELNAPEDVLKWFSKYPISGVIGYRMARKVLRKAKKYDGC
jgi:hypothetical protein